MRYISLIFLSAFLSIPPLYGLDPLLAEKLQHTLDRTKNATNFKGLSASVTMPGQGTRFGVSGPSHQNVNISPGMYFGIASNTKTFFSVLVLKLSEQSLISLNDSIYHWVGNHRFINSTGKRSIPVMTNHYPENASNVATALFNTLINFPTYINRDDYAHSGKYELYPNYPNPFNPSTTIRFSIQQRTYVTLRVYDILGKEILTFADGVMEAGGHSAVLLAGNLPSGVYFYKITTEFNSQTKKALVVK